MIDYREELIRNSDNCHARYLPHVSVDTVIFGFHDDELRVLLLKMHFNKQWFLPGGYVLKQEDLSDAAKRVLQFRTGVQDVYLKQFGVFGKHDRSQKWFDDFDDTLWQKQRFISVGYYALVDYSKVIPSKDDWSEACEWKMLSELDELKLTMDHPAILQAGLEALRNDTLARPIGYNLLPEKFTIPQLQRLYETILGRKLNRGNFYRKITKYDLLEKVGEAKMDNAIKPQIVYQLNQQKYQSAMENGFRDKNGI